MGADYPTLCNWRTPDLILRYKTLWARTEVLGISQNAATIHILVLIVTSGTSLPFNISFGVWHVQRYKKAKKEWGSIARILISRNVVYHGKGQWGPTVNDLRAQFVQAAAAAVVQNMDNYQNMADQQNYNTDQQTSYDGCSY